MMARSDLLLAMLLSPASVAPETLGALEDGDCARCWRTMPWRMSGRFPRR